MDNIVIRREAVADQRLVENLVREAFWNVYVPGCSEHYLAHRMREHPDFIPELNYVAVYDGNIVGSIMYTRAWLLGDGGEQQEIVSFGPVSVLPEYQRQGIGSALIRHTLELAGRKYEGVVIMGDPHNYCKHGFKSARDFSVSDENGEYPFAMLALELKKGAFAGGKRTFRGSDVFIMDEADIGAFDKGFAAKEKQHRVSQDIFSIEVRAYLK